MADVVHELVVIIVAVVAAHRFDVPAVFVVELVHKHYGQLDVIELGETAGDPFIPAGDEDEARILLERAVPLLSNVQAVTHCIRARVCGAMTETTPMSAVLAHRAEAAADRVLGDTDRHLLLLPGRIGENMLGKHLEPAPHVRFRRSLEIIRLGFAECEEVEDSPRVSVATGNQFRIC